MTNESDFGWKNFILELQENILPIYRGHEDRFDFARVHGQMHICRALIFGEVLARTYFSAGAALDFYGLRTAIAFHDSGRQGNHKDVWEKDSEENCRQYLLARPAYGQNPDWARAAAKWIGKHGKVELEHLIVFDADVLEIMRPCCGHGGIDRFDRTRLRFLGERDAWGGPVPGKTDLREQIVQEAWRFIRATEKLKEQWAGSAQHMEAVLGYLGEQKSQYPLLAQVCLTSALDGLDEVRREKER